MKRYAIAILIFSFSFTTLHPVPMAPVIVIGHINVMNPVIALLGNITMSLAVVAHNAYQMCQQKYASYLQNVPDIQEEVLLAERHYYQEQKNALQKIRNEFVTVKCGIEAIQGLRHMGNASFTQQFLQKRSYDVIKSKHEITSTQEKRLSDEQKKRLRKVREEELALLEQQIYNIQLILALHVNHIIDAVVSARSVYDQALKDHQKALSEWNNNLQCLTDDIALRTYQSNLLQYYLLCRMRTTIDELTLIAAYYHTCAHECINNTTTILYALERMNSIITEVSKLITEEDKRLRDNIVISENYFAHRGISVVKLKHNIKNVFDNKQQENDAQIIKGLEDALSHYSSTGGPKKDDEEEKIKFPANKNDIKHIFRNKEGHFSKDTPEIRKMLEDFGE